MLLVWLWSCRSEQALAAKFATLLPHLDERQRRLFLAAEARALGHGGVSTVARAAGISAVTVSRGVDELDAGGEPSGRTRRPGGGRKPLTHTDPGLRATLLALVEPESRGDPESPLRWTTKSTRQLPAELAAPGTACRRPRWPSCSRPRGTACRATARPSRAPSTPTATPSSATSTTRPAPHRHRRPGDQRRHQEEAAGRTVQKGGQEWRPRGEPQQVDLHDFMAEDLGKAIPYGVYDLAADAGWVSVGTDHDTAEFAVATIEPWWSKAGSPAYPEASTAAHHRRRRRLQRPPPPAVENRVGPTRRTPPD